MTYLTPRESAVVGLIAEGKTNKDIASDLGITIGTAKVYVRRIMDKVGVRNRLALALWYRQPSFTADHDSRSV